MISVVAALLLQSAVPAQLLAPTPVRQLVLPAGTSVRLKTIDPMDSRTASQGQRFKLQVTEDVMAGSVVVIPQGTAAVGEVEAVSGKGMVGKSGSLVLRPLFIEVAGKRVNLAGTTSESGSDATGGVAVASILTNGLSLFITGKSASVPAGSVMLGRIRTDVTLPASAASPAIEAKPQTP